MSYELKTRRHEWGVEEFLNTIENPKKWQEAKILEKIFREVSGAASTMWGENIIWYGEYSYKDSKWKDHEWFQVGFSPRKAGFSFYIMPWYQDMSDILAKLWKHKAWKCCINIKTIADIDLKVLEKIIRKGINSFQSKW